MLRQRAIEVVDFDRELRTLVSDLTDTMLDAPGAGLAAPQIGVGLRVFTWYVDGEVGHLVNPVLDLSEEEQYGEEGCLSIPELSFDCTRALSVVARGFDMHGEPVTIEGSDLLFELLSSVSKDPREGTFVVSVLRNVTDLGLAKQEIEESPGLAPGLFICARRGG